MKNFITVFLASCIIFTANAVWAGESQVVYDNTAHYEGAYLSDIFAAEPPQYKGSAIGELVRREGQSPFITQFLTILRNDPEETDVTAYVRLTLRRTQLDPREPGRRIWQSRWQRVRLTDGLDKIVRFEVPHVRVPRFFVWTLEFGGPFDAYVARPSIPFYDPPVVGGNASGYYYFNFLGQEWQHLDIGGTSFYAKIWAAQNAAEEDLAIPSISEGSLD